MIWFFDKLSKFERVTGCRTSPFINYRSIQMLLSSRFNSDPRTAYCSLTISYNMDLRDQATKKLVYDTPDLPLEETITLFSAAQQSWEASKECQELRSILLNTKHLSRISKIVGFAFGSLSHTAHPNAARLRRRSTFQHALLLILSEVIRTKGDRTNLINCFVQDPIYSLTDISALAHYGINVLEDPMAFLEIDEFTAIVSCSPDIPVKQIVADISRPALILWNQVVQNDDSLKRDLCSDSDVISLVNLFTSFLFVNL